MIRVVILEAEVYTTIAGMDLWLHRPKMASKHDPTWVRNVHICVTGRKKCAKTCHKWPKMNLSIKVGQNC